MRMAKSRNDSRNASRNASRKRTGGVGFGLLFAILSLVSSASILQADEAGPAPSDYSRLLLRKVDGPDVIQKEAVKTIDRLILSGNKEYAGIDLMQLKNDLLHIEVQYRINATPPRSAGDRRTAFYLPRDHMIVVRDPLVRIFPEVADPVPVAALGLHESLGVLGYDDRNYQISLRMAFLAKDPMGKLRQMVWKTSPAEILMDRPSGGSTSVGGGGDLSALRIKAETIEFLVRDYDVDANFISHVMAIPFEPNYWDEDPEIRYATSDATESSDRSVIVRLPLQRYYAEHLSGSDLMIRELAGGLVSLYGENNRIPRVIVASCTDGELIEMPVVFPLKYQALRRQLLEKWLSPRYELGRCRINP